MSTPVIFIKAGLLDRTLSNTLRFIMFFGSWLVDAKFFIYSIISTSSSPLTVSMSPYGSPVGPIKRNLSYYKLFIIRFLIVKS